MERYRKNLLALLALAGCASTRPGPPVTPRPWEGQKETAVVVSGATCRGYAGLDNGRPLSVTLTRPCKAQGIALPKGMGLSLHPEVC